MANDAHNEPEEEFLYEEADDEGGEQAQKDREKKLREKLKQCENERQEYLDGWQRAKADFINARKADDEARATLREAVKDDILTQILPVVDSFELAFRDRESWKQADEKWRRGVEHIYAQLVGILENNDIQRIHPVGETFNPQKHEAIETVPTEKKEEDGTIVEVTQNGYEINEKVIRPARVRVAQYSKASDL